MCENVKMQIAEIPIKVPYIILNMVIRIPQNIKIKITLNSTVLTKINKIT